MAFIPKASPQLLLLLGSFVYIRKVKDVQVPPGHCL
jgi:hypothetical protein